MPPSGWLDMVMYAPSLGKTFQIFFGDFKLDFELVEDGIEKTQHL